MEKEYVMHITNKTLIKCRKAYERGYRVDDNTGEVISPYGRRLSQKRLCHGYVSFSFTYKEGESSKVYGLRAHTYAFFCYNIENPKIMLGKQINHINSIRTDNRRVNLEVVTHHENILHSIEFGEATKGEDSNFAKLTEEDVLDIFYSCGKVHYRDLAEKYNVTRSQVQRIWRKASWKWLLKDLTNNYRPQKRLSESQVKELRTLSGIKTQRELSSIFNLSIASVSKIVNGDTYKEVV